MRKLHLAWIVVAVVGLVLLFATQMPTSARQAAGAARTGRRQ